MKDTQIKSWHLHISGQVQGIGYRPLVYKLAKAEGICGWVKNDIDGLHIKFNATSDKAEQFTENVTKDSAPPISIITSVSLLEIDLFRFEDFIIRQDDSTSEPKLLITPDIALCSACKTDLKNNKRRRFSYPFTTCSHCGPRYSIISKLPYDRHHTTMEPYLMCSECMTEYSDPSDRRYFAQTNSCSTCGIKMQFHDSTNKLIAQDLDEIINLTLKFWEAGKIIAIKGIGGFLLTCDASNSATIANLRERKHRPSKPFALMLPDATHLGDYKINESIVSELENHIAPIILTSLKKGNAISAGIADGLDKVGIMLPYVPIMKVLLSRFQKPIIATSGNVSNASIIYSNENAKTQLVDISDFILSNDRVIVIPQDDSVIAFTPKEQQKIVYRRSRGLAPTFINNKKEWPSETILAMGAQLKSTFSLLNKENVYISQYLGNLEQFESLSNYKHVQNHLLNLFLAKPNMILCDKHPDYQSSKLAQELSDKWSVPTHTVQHHVAHFSAIIGEHDLIDSTEPILGVIWDGTGLGNDDNIWGGEFFSYKNYQFKRVHHLPYFNSILGDKMSKEPRISALSLCQNLKHAEKLIKQKFTLEEWNIYSKVLIQKNHFKTSSMGRLFDAVASLLGILDKQTYEGEAAMLLEVEARKYFDRTNYRDLFQYESEEFSYEEFSATTLISMIVHDLANGIDKNLIAAKFHGSLVRWIEAIADKEKCTQIAFSGGVFQNSLLVDLILIRLKNQFKLFFHDQLSPNDENISFGQLINYEIGINLAKKA